MERPDDKRYVAELPSGLIKNPGVEVSGVDLFVNDVVFKEKGIVYPMYGEGKIMYGVCASNGVKGGYVLVATHERGEGK